jgi:hypothetical protein
MKEVGLKPWITENILTPDLKVGFINNQFVKGI